MVLFSGGLPSDFFCQAKHCFSALPWWVNMSESSPFIRPTGPPSGCLYYRLTWVVIGQSLGPYFWDSWLPLSFCSTRPASPTWSSWEPSDLSGDQGDPLGLLQDVFWVLSRNPQIPDYFCDSIIVIMDLDWLCTGVLKVRHPCLVWTFINYSAFWRSKKILISTSDVTPLMQRQTGL